MLWLIGVATEWLVHMPAGRRRTQRRMKFIHCLSTLQCRLSYFFALNLDGSLTDCTCSMRSISFSPSSISKTALEGDFSFWPVLVYSWEGHPNITSLGKSPPWSEDRENHIFLTAKITELVDELPNSICLLGSSLHFYWVANICVTVRLYASYMNFSGLVRGFSHKTMKSFLTDTICHGPTQLVETLVRTE